MIKLPFISHDLVAFRKIGQANAATRHQAGAKVKDLWYHLVRLAVFSLCFYAA